MHAGALVDSDVGLGLAIEPAGKKWIVLLASGDEVRLGDDDLFYDTPSSVDVTDRTAAIQFLEHAESKLEQLAAQSETDVLWELTVDDPTPFAVSFAAEFLFAATGAVERVAAVRALRADHARFQARKRMLFRPRELDRVEALLGAKARDVEREQEFEAFLDRLLAVIDRPDELGSWLEENDHRTFIDRVKYRAADPEFESAEVDEILTAIFSRSPHLSDVRRLDRAAFDLLVHLGVWDEHFLLGLWREQIAVEFTEAQLLAAANAPIADRPRVDRTGVATFTIDGASTSDFDDAITIEQQGEQTFVGVHIADVAARIFPGSELDQLARERATSVYLPTDKIPMLPPSLTEETSLTAGLPRPVVSFFFTFDGTAVTPHTIELSTILVDENLRYLEADKQLSHDPRLQILAEVHDALLATRLENGAVQIERPPEQSIHVDLTGDEPQVSLDVVARARTRDFVSELAIAAGASAARYCLDHGLPTLYRAQDVVVPPEGLEDLPPLARSFALLRTMKRSEFTSIPRPHRVLGLSVYSQATSPIRRYVDLFVLQQITHHMAYGVGCHDHADVLRALAAIEHRTRAAAVLDRESAKYWTLWKLGRDKPNLDGVVVEIRPGRENRPEVYFPSIGRRHAIRVNREITLGESVTVVVNKSHARSGVLWLDEV